MANYDIIVLPPIDFSLNPFYYPKFISLKDTETDSKREKEKMRKERDRTSSTGSLLKCPKTAVPGQALELQVSHVGDMDPII